VQHHAGYGRSAGVRVKVDGPDFGAVDLGTGAGAQALGFLIVDNALACRVGRSGVGVVEFDGDRAVRKTEPQRVEPLDVTVFVRCLVPFTADAADRTAAPGTTPICGPPTRFRPK